MSKKKSVSYNPFSENTAGKYFVGRDEQLLKFKKLISGLLQGSPTHLYVTGVHGTGKTSYLAKLGEVAADYGVLSALTTLDGARPARHHIKLIKRS